MLRHLIAFLALLASPFAHSQGRTKINLATQVQGQLPAANAAGIYGAAASSAVQSVYAAGVTSVSGAKRGIQSMHGFTEQFNPDVRCMPGSSNAFGYDKTANLDCSVPGFYHGSGAMDLERTLEYGVTNNLPPSFNHFSLTFANVWGPNSNTNAYVGMSTCAVGQYNCGSGNEFGLIANSTGLYLQDAGTTITLWRTGGTTFYSTIGQDDSGFGYTNTGARTGGAWAPPAAGLYGFSLMLPGDGTAIISGMPMGGAICYTGTCSYVARVPITLPAGSFHQFFVRGQSGDYISDVSYAGGYSLYSDHRLPIYDLPFFPNVHVGRMLRWAHHADGSDWDYRTSSNDIASNFAVIPPNYDPKAANPWAIQSMGQENSTISFFGTFNNVTQQLYDSGVAQVYMDFHQGNHYGSPQDMTDIASAASDMKRSLSLASRPYLMADSAGGAVTLNAISHGVLSPLALYCVSCNVNLAWDVSNGQMPYIQGDYGFQLPAQYAAYVNPPGQISYDPTLAVQTPGPGQDRLTSTPMMFVTNNDGGDTVVDSNQNSILFSGYMNGIRPGSATLVYTNGIHVSANKFNPTQALGFFNQN